MYKSSKVITISLALAATLLLSGCSNSPATPDVGPTSASTSTTTPAIPNAVQGTTAADNVAVEAVLRDFLTGAFNVNQDQRTEFFAAFQTEQEWTDEDKEGILNGMIEMMPELELIDVSGLTLDEKAGVYFSALSYSRGATTQLELTIPENVILVNGDTATIDTSKVVAVIEGENVSVDYLLEIEPSIDLIKIDGSWFLSGTDLVSQL